MRDIPIVEVADVVDPNWEGWLRRTDGPYVDGALPGDELRMLCGVVAKERPAIVLEIGTFYGVTTLAIAKEIVEWGGIIHTVDLPPDSSQWAWWPKSDEHLITKAKYVGDAFKGMEEALRIHQHFADTALWNFRAAYGAELCFIDGSHTYEYVQHDTLACLELNPKVIMWHDVDKNHPDVVRYLGELRELGYKVRRIRGTRLGYLKRDRWKATWTNQVEEKISEIQKMGMNLGLVGITCNKATVKFIVNC